MDELWAGALRSVWQVHEDTERSHTGGATGVMLWIKRVRRSLWGRLIHGGGIRVGPRSVDPPLPVQHVKRMHWIRAKNGPIQSVHALFYKTRIHDILEVVVVGSRGRA